MSLSAPQRSCVLFLSAPQFDRTQTIEQFAKTIGVDKRTVSRWQQDKEFAAALDKGRKAYKESPDFYALCVRQKALQLLHEGMDKKVGKGKDEITSSERRQYIDAVLRETRDVADSLDTVDRSRLSDAELMSECINRSVGDGLSFFFAAHDLLMEGESCTNSSPSGLEESSPSPDSTSVSASASETDCPPSN